MPAPTRKNLKVALAGAAGRMGQEIQLLAPESRIQIVHAIEGNKDWTKVSERAVDVVVDFSSPAGLTQALKWCVENRKPLLTGTTGFSTELNHRLRRASAKIPILYSANMSLGIAVMMAMFNSFAGLEDWDFQIEEAHHSLKKDKPSGTALLLQEKLAQVAKRKLPPPNSIRGGGIAGIHQVWAMGPDEAIVVQHTAFHRKVFAQGAVRAARWLFDKKAPGLYDLSDLYK